MKCASCKNISAIFNYQEIKKTDTIDIQFWVKTNIGIVNGGNIKKAKTDCENIMWQFDNLGNCRW